MKLFAKLSRSSGREPIETQAPLQKDSIDRPLTLAKNTVVRQKGALGLTPLSCPSDPDVDLIFVHGLGGDSRKTWGTTNGQSACWPVDWLPSEEGFERTRIHTFGYDTKFLKGPGNCLNVHHLGKLLLGELETAPSLFQPATRIIFIAHSMGGLVVKKTILLAKQDPTYQELAERFAAVMFLACPHHGADSAKLLRRILSPVYDRQYLADLERNSGALQLINDDFRHYASTLNIWSFYETVKMNLWSPLVVDESSAVLNYPEEKQRPMIADHRSICKFNSPDESNYLTLRNTIAFIMTELRQSAHEAVLSLASNQSKAVREFLDYHSVPHDTLDSLRDVREPETCDWIFSQEAFCNWTTEADNRSSLLWISAKPGSGKSVLGSFVADYLAGGGHNVLSYFFRFNDARSSTFEDCIRSLTYQLAMTDETCRESLLKMRADGVRLDGMKARPLWRILSQAGAFFGIKGRRYFILDGLDECGEPQILFETLAQVMEDESSAHFRFLILGRDLPSDFGLSNQGNLLLYHLDLAPSHTFSAISTVVNRRMASIATINQQTRPSIATRVLEQSQGSFLWTDLVLHELSKCHSEKEIFETLENMPEGMEAVYQRILATVGRNDSSVHLAESILTWVLCAARPLTIYELETALEVDLNTKFTHFGDTVTALCGQLIIVDEIGRIRLQHETARAFLLKQNGEHGFTFNESRGHARAASTCLRYLQEARRTLFSGTSMDSFTVYCLLELPLHLSKVSSESKELLDATARFLKSQLLPWIESVVRYRNLSALNLASSHLHAFCKSQSSLSPVASMSLSFLSQLAIDLPRVTYEFGAVLASRPEDIHTVIPEFCPVSSTIHRSRKQNKHFQVIGNRASRWNDTLCTLSMSSRIRAIDQRGQYLALAIRPGIVSVLDAATYQEVRALDHGEEVELVALKDDNMLLASTGPCFTKVWSLSQRHCLYRFEHTGIVIIGLRFDGERLLAPRHNDVSFAWRLDTGEPEPSCVDPFKVSEKSRILMFDISITERLVALSNDRSDVTLLDLDTGEFIGTCGEPSQYVSTESFLLDISFNPRDGLLAIGRGDELVILDPRFNEMIRRRAARCDILVTSPDGSVLAALDTAVKPARINLYDYSTLTLLYAFDSTAEDIEMMCFSENGTHIAGVYGRYASQFIVWGLEQAPTNNNKRRLVGSGDFHLPANSDIQMVLAPLEEDIIVCLRADGTVAAYDAQTCQHRGLLFKSACSLQSIHWWPGRRAVLCVGTNKKITLQGLVQSSTHPGGLEGQQIFDFILDTGSWVHDVMISEHDRKMIISTCQELSYLYSDSGTLLGTASFARTAIDRRFATLPDNEGIAFCFSELSGVQRYNIGVWSGHPENTDMTRFVRWPLCNGVFALFFFQYGLYMSPDKKTTVVKAGSNKKAKGPVTFILKLNLELLPPKNAEPLPDTDQDDGIMTPPQTPGTPQTPQEYSTLYNVPLKQIIAVLDEGRVLFIDDSLWLSSLDLTTARPVSSVPGSDGLSVTASLSYDRHFYIPADVFKGEDVEISCAMMGTDLVLALHGEPIVVKGFLQHKHEVRFDSYISHEVLRGDPWDGL